MLAFALTVPDGAAFAWVLAGTTGYALGAVLWCVVLAVRSRTNVLLADLDPGALDSPQVRMLEESLTALFQAFVLITAVALAALGATLAFTGTAPAWTAAVLLLTGAAAATWLLRTGDVIPAVLYLPILLLGLTLV